ncbi:hypothetical protein [Laspinema olomoucense]|uniref:Uncharacterized protein n=1 Tax=Laspinema olomoucense D3b TaxID=2953688 RepID=A0ABT2NBH6_9CYAN|nr:MULTISPECIES: hypothetical protein [unclassified Laspinema]MCT7975806.1 hypothetical protein [Laspinema sp. D3d]MCT7979199.1 hypothetical protein [Laspinema sp. D3b]MCT7991319.1 hypothetical protein [Laspinema sp. D3a]MCT7997094.1 hypothetical protein [Laspinema sp. D3c]
MNKAAHDTVSESAAALLTHYSFDLGGYSTGELIAEWLLEYPAAWVRLATIEALYQGRYKAVSVTHILACWKRRNQALYHFNHEFERLVSSQLPKGWKGSADTGEKMSSTQGFTELSQTGVFPRAIPSSDVRHLERQTSGNNLAQSAALETPAIATPEENAPLPDSKAPIPAPPGPQEPDSLSPELSPIDPEDAPTRATSFPETLNPGTKEPGITGIAEAIAPNCDDLLGDLWLDRPQLQPIRNPKATFTDLKPSSESSVAIEEAQKEESSEAIVNNSPIHQFTPKETSSDFYSKLKAVSQKQPQSPPKG